MQRDRRLRGAVRRLRRGARRLLLRALAAWAPGGERPLPELSRLDRLLVVNVNFRLGNNVLAAAAVVALADSFPASEIDVLGAPIASTLLLGHPLHRVLTFERRHLASLPQWVALVRHLRRRRYDAAIHLNTSTTSLGGLLVRLSGARHRIGCRRDSRNFYFTTALEPPAARHKVDRLNDYLAKLGVVPRTRPSLRLSEHELQWASQDLAKRLPPAREAAALFVSGRRSKGKHWDFAYLRAVAAGLRQRGLEPIVFLGPEEHDRAPGLRRELGHARIVEEADLRRVAALLRRCAVVVAPDSGPMHLAVAVGVPTVGLFRRPNFDRWGPRPPEGVVVFDPEMRRSDLVVEVAARTARTVERRALAGASSRPRR